MFIRKPQMKPLLYVNCSNLASGAPWNHHHHQIVGARPLASPGLPATFSPHKILILPSFGTSIQRRKESSGGLFCQKPGPLPGQTRRATPRPDPTLRQGKKLLFLSSRLLRKCSLVATNARPVRIRTCVPIITVHPPQAQPLLLLPVPSNPTGLQLMTSPESHEKRIEPRPV